MLEKKPDINDIKFIKNLIEKKEKKSIFNEKSILYTILCDTKYVRLFKNSISYIETCKSIINMEIKNAHCYKESDLYNYYFSIYRSYLGYYQLLMQNKTNAIEREICYINFCKLKQCKTDEYFYQVLDFLFSIYYKFENIYFYNQLINLLNTVNSDYLDILQKSTKGEFNLTKSEYQSRLLKFLRIKNIELDSRRKYRHCLNKLLPKKYESKILVKK